MCVLAYAFFIVVVVGGRGWEGGSVVCVIFCFVVFVWFVCLSFIIFVVVCWERGLGGKVVLFVLYFVLLCLFCLFSCAFFHFFGSCLLGGR